MIETVTINNKKYSVLFTYEEENGNKYIYYTDNSFDDNGKLNVVVGLYEIVNNEYKVSDIEDDLTMKKAIKILEEILKNINKK